MYKPSIPYLYLLDRDKEKCDMMVDGRWLMVDEDFFSVVPFRHGKRPHKKGARVYHPWPTYLPMPIPLLASNLVWCVWCAEFDELKYNTNPEYFPDVIPRPPQAITIGLVKIMADGCGGLPYRNYCRGNPTRHTTY